MSEKSSPQNRVQREARLQWVPISMMRVNPLAQQELNQSWVDRIVAEFDLEQVGNPTVNKRGGLFYIMDGQHRVEGMKAIGYGDQQMQCWVYDGLSEQEEAETFLKLNNRKAVSSFSKFKVGVQAGRETECDIDRIVRAADCVVTLDRIDGGISAVGTLMRVYQRSGPKTLARTIRIARDAYGSPGLESAVLDGIAFLCARYNGELEDQVAVLKLGKIHGGANGLLQRAEILKRQTGISKGQAVAAAAVDILNAGRGGKKLPAWFREDAA